MAAQKESEEATVQSAPPQGCTGIAEPRGAEETLRHYRTQHHNAERCAMQNALSIVLVTSPIQMHPATDLIDAVIESLDLVEGLEGCRLIVVADGVRIANNGQSSNRGTALTVVPTDSSMARQEENGGQTQNKLPAGLSSRHAENDDCGAGRTSTLSSGEVPNDAGTWKSTGQSKSPNYPKKVKDPNQWRQGVVTEDSFAHYREYVLRLRSKHQTADETDHEAASSRVSNAEENTEDGARRRSTLVMGPLPQHGGFSFALLAGLKEVRTKYVLVVQHDRIFCEKFAIAPVLELFERQERDLPPGTLEGYFAGSSATDSATTVQTEGSVDNKATGTTSGKPWTSSWRDPLDEPLLARGKANYLAYVGFPSKTTANYLAKCRSRGPFTKVARSLLQEHQETATTGKLLSAPTQRRTETEIKIEASPNLGTAPTLADKQTKVEAATAELAQKLTPLFYRYDSSHVCRTQEYIELIESRCKANQFIESTLEPPMERQISKQYAQNDGVYRFADHLANIGVFLYRGHHLEDPNLSIDLTAFDEEPLVRHLDGRKFWTAAQRQRQGWPGDTCRGELVGKIRAAAAAVTEGEGGATADDPTNRKLVVAAGGGG